ncbi:MAG: CBS domain-containing protein [Mariprofundaceae bacterium]|nr:CBS domain-containing protein [Mariprofundaceae bacterium]
MLAERTMVTDIVTAFADETVESVLNRMRNAKLRMIPVVDADGMLIGVISTFSIMKKVLPDYITTGDLDHISYAPDLGILRRHYAEVAELKVAEVMDRKPLLVNWDESLLAVSAAMISHSKHAHAMVVDENQHLLGIISASDVLSHLREEATGENDA